MSESVAVRLTPAQVAELTALEVDTVDEHSPAGKAAFADAVRSLNPRSGGVLLLNGEALDYARTDSGPFANGADIARDNGRHALAAALERKHREIGGARWSPPAGVVR